jgi:hypothetical protein
VGGCTSNGLPCIIGGVSGRKGERALEMDSVSNGIGKREDELER